MIIVEDLEYKKPLGRVGFVLLNSAEKKQSTLH